jgi:hypothetical protein
MEAITVFTNNEEEGRVLKAFLNALKMQYVPTTVEQLQKLEDKLTPSQKAWWLELKTSIKAIERGENEGSVDLDDFLKDMGHADKIGSLVSA